MEPLQWCRQRLLVKGNPLTASLPFAAPVHQDAILALRAVITEVASIPGGVSDPEVALAKLDWWRRALVEQLPHPAVRALAETSAAERLDQRHFSELVDGVTLTLDNPRFEHRERAWDYFMRVGAPAARLEAGLVGGDEAEVEALAVIGANACLVRQVRDLGVDAQANRWLVPLDIQAEFQVSRQDALRKKASAGFDGMVRQWLADGLRRAARMRDSLDVEAAWRQRHLLILHALDHRLAAKLARRPHRILEGRVLPGQLGNAWRAWRTVRRLRLKA
jgi:15-cis-phytoene synthase